MKPRILVPLFVCISLVLTANEADLRVLADSANYTAWSTGATPMNAVWQINSGVAPTILTGAPAPAGEKYFNCNNGVVTAPLDAALTHDFELSFDALHSNYARLLWLGLFNDDGTQGYVAAWDSSLVSYYGSQGYVRIRKFDVADPTSGLNYNSAGTGLGVAGVASGHNAGNTTGAAITGPFAKIRFTWTKATGELRIYVNGVLKQTAHDTSFTRFSRIYMSGYSGSRIDNVVVRFAAGANVPFVTHQAEGPDITTNATIVSLQGAPANAESSPELEASGRAFVALTGTGHYLEFPVTAAANTLVVRHCTPDAPGGGGQTATLGLYVNGVRRQSLGLSSRYNWLYGNPLQGRSNSPAPGLPQVFWDETRFQITGAGLQPGDVLRIQKDTTDTAAYYRIDLIDLEQAPAPLSPPPAGTWLSVVDYGAGTGNVVSDTAAIKACISAARFQGKTVWFPAGTYYQNEQFVLDGVKVRGAGMWHTALIGTLDTSVNDFGFRIAGNGSEVHDLLLENAAVSIRGSGAKAFTSAVADQTTNWRVENVWVTHSHVGFWMSGVTLGIVRNCRVRFTYADALTFSLGASNNLIENNHIRGAGDDGVAFLSETSGAASLNNTVRGNTIAANWWGHNCDLAGGSGHVVENNYLADNSAMGCLTINLPGVFPMHALSDSVIRGNLVARGGGRMTGQVRGAVWLYTGSTTAQNVVVEDNHIIDSLYRGIHLAGASAQHLEFERNQIINPGLQGVFIQGSVIGSGVFTDNFVSGATSSDFQNDAGSGYTVSGSGNNW